MEQLRFTKVRPVKSPTRANEGDAGIDFYTPELSFYQLIDNIPQNKEGYYQRKDLLYTGEGSITILQGGRILIPSGIKVLIDPRESMLMAANKSGVASKEGLLYTAEIVDSPYTGEIHIGVFNSGTVPVTLDIIDVPQSMGKKLMQFIHVPIILSTPTQISDSEYDKLAKEWGTRGSNGFGSSDNK